VSFFGGIKKIVKPLLDIPRWIDYAYLIKTQRSFFSFAKTFFTPTKVEAEETFDAALLRLGLTAEDLQQRLKVLRRLLGLWIVLLCLSVLYSIYLFTEHALRGFFPCLGLNLIILTQVFRYHFWIFQIKQRRLGCSFRDWFNALFFSGKK
jgi:intracellular multiplication protein IcmV